MNVSFICYLQEMNEKKVYVTVVECIRVKIYLLQAACTRVCRGHSGVHCPQELSLTVRQDVHRLERHVDSITGVVDSQHIYRDPVICHRPTLPTVRRVPSRNAVRGSKEGELEERAKSRKLGCEAIGAVGAGNCAGGLASVIVSCVVTDSCGNGGGNEEGGGGDDREELHDGKVENGRWCREVKAKRDDERTAERPQCLL